MPTKTEPKPRKQPSGKSGQLKKAAKKPAIKFKPSVDERLGDFEERLELTQGINDLAMQRLAELEKCISQSNLKTISDGIDYRTLKLRIDDLKKQADYNMERIQDIERPIPIDGISIDWEKAGELYRKFKLAQPEPEKPIDKLDGLLQRIKEAHPGLSEIELMGSLPVILCKSEDAEEESPIDDRTDLEKKINSIYWMFKEQHPELPEGALLEMLEGELGKLSKPTALDAKLGDLANAMAELTRFASKYPSDLFRVTWLPRHNKVSGVFRVRFDVNTQADWDWSGKQTLADFIRAQIAKHREGK